jgi:hypothetical protein
LLTPVGSFGAPAGAQALVSWLRVIPESIFDCTKATVAANPEA